MTSCEHPLRPGDQLEYRRPPWREPPSANHVDVLYLDPHVLVVHKPANLQVLPGGVVVQRTVLSLLESAAQQLSVRGTVPSPCHRLGGNPGAAGAAASTPTLRLPLHPITNYLETIIEPIPPRRYLSLPSSYSCPLSLHCRQGHLGSPALRLLTRCQAVHLGPV